MTFEEFTRLPATEEHEMLLQSIAIISTHPCFEMKTLEEVYDLVVKQAAEVKAMG